MASTPQWKVYRDGEYVAACKHPEDAAALVSTFGGVVKHDHKLVVWTEGAEEFIAGESYDGAAEIMIARRNEAAKADRARFEARTRKFLDEQKSRAHVVYLER